ncbi:NEUFC protein, partial [Halcyon senegalensis]|nr:NEUFC protein [Halcyon senegalensis]
TRWRGPMRRGAAAAALLGLGAACLLGRGFDPRPWLRLFLLPLPPSRGRLLSAGELARYRGAQGQPGLYLAVLGRVFDVERGRRHYGPGGAYSGLAGTSDSRVLQLKVALTFSSLTSLCLSLSCVDLLMWANCCVSQEEEARKLVGRFYDENGAPTEALRQAEAAIEEAQKFQAESEHRKQQFPPCNSEWSSAKGSRFWCSTQSGGVNRDWAGVPRKLYQPGSRRSHCVCVRTTGPPWDQLDATEHSNRGDLDDPHLQEYEGCHPLAEQCVLTL